MKGERVWAGWRWRNKDKKKSRSEMKTRRDEERTETKGNRGGRKKGQGGSSCKLTLAASENEWKSNGHEWSIFSWRKKS